MADYTDKIHVVEGKPTPRIGREGLTICGWCGSRVEGQQVAREAPWLCEDCGISRRAHHARSGLPPLPRQQATGLIAPVPAFFS